MRGMVRICLMVMAILALPLAAGADQGKIGVINLDDALGNSNAGKAAFSQLKSKFEAREKAINQQGEELKKMQDELQKTSVALSKDAMAAKAADFEAKVKKFRDDGAKLQQEEQQAQQSVLQPLLNKLQKTVSDYAAKNGYTVILEARQVPYFDPKLDITLTIRQEFDKAK